VGVAATLTLDDAGKCKVAKIVLLSVGDGPVAAQQGADLLAGEQPTAQVIAAAADVVGKRDIDPPDDIHASAAFRRHLARVLTRRALTSAVARARG
jgi:CO/xanthine dehydrogenase FAD-binding subunit